MTAGAVDPSPPGPAGPPPDLLGVLSRTLTHVYSGYLYADGEYEDVFLGPGAGELLGTALTPGPGTGAAWEAAVHPDDRDRYRQAGLRLAADSTVSIEYRLVQPDASVRWVLERIWVRGAAGPDRLLVDGVVTDVNELHERTDEAHRAMQEAQAAQRETAAAKEALDEASAKLAAAVQASPCAMIMTDLAGLVTLWNPAAEKMLGWSAAEVLGQTVPHVPAERRQAYLREVADGAEAMTYAEHEETRITRSGTRLQVSLSSAPVCDADGKPVGLLALLTDITRRKAMEAQLRHVAESDLLTGLANRSCLMQRTAVSLAARSGSRDRVSLLLLDLDGFKAVNDTFGHAVGDELLVGVAERLRSCLRADDVPARIGGDEFAVLLVGVPAAECLRVADRVLAAIAEPLELTRCNAAVTASIGLVHAGPASSTEELVRDADVAMYSAKAAGRGRVVVFQRSMQQQVATRLSLEGELRRAVESEQFVLHHQPLVHLETGAIVGVEALVRWAHPTRGLLGPGEFIAAAEETGLVVGLGRWVIEEAARTAAGWQRPLDGRAVTMAVNLSPRQLLDAGLLDYLAQVLVRCGLPSSAFVVEITESLRIDDATVVGRRLADMRAMGVRVALDDFGTGYSSLAYLRRYPVDILKIDRSFVTPLGRGPKPGALVRSIIEVASALDLDTVAEGVENAQQAAALRRLGCRVGQGFYFRPPLPAAELDTLLGAGRPLLPGQPSEPDASSSRPVPTSAPTRSS